MVVSAADTVTLSVAPDPPRPPSSLLLPRVQGSIVTEYGGEVMTKQHFDAYQELNKLNPAAAAEWKRHYRVFSDYGQYATWLAPAAAPCRCGCLVFLVVRHVP
jgi:hypothetical protein